MVDFLKQYGGQDQEASWEPNTEVVIKSFSKWMMHNPAPKWILTDSATYFTSQRMMDFAGQSGIGLLTTPAEAHHMLGAEEGAINIIRKTVSRLLKDEPDIDVEMAYQLASHGHNATIGPSGFSPFQWVRGSSAPIENIPVGVNPRRAFEECSSSRRKLVWPSRLKVLEAGCQAQQHHSKAHPSLQDGPTCNALETTPKARQDGWLLDWSCTSSTTRGWHSLGSHWSDADTRSHYPAESMHQKEEMASHLEGTAILRMPVTLESLLRNFTGRHFSDVTRRDAITRSTTRRHSRC